MNNKIKMTPPKRLLSSDECTTIHKLRKNGMPLHLIGKEIHRSKNLVSLYLRYPEKYSELVQSVSSSPNTSLVAKPKPKKQKVAESDNAKPVQSKKMIRVDNDNKKITSEEEIKKFNKVAVEHRAVIKYLTKKGIGPRCIFEDMEKVYGSPAPDLPSVLFWCKQYKSGRETIINDPRIIPNLNGSLSSPTKPAKSSNASATTSASVKTTPEKKLFKIKFSGIKRLKA